MTQVIGTPSSFEPVASAATLEGLELLRTLEQVATRAAGPLGAAAVRARRPTAERDRIAAELATVAELADLLRAGDRFRAEPIDDLAPVLRTLDKAGAPLDGIELVTLGRALEAIGTVRKELGRLDETAPRVAALQRPVPPAGVGRGITAALDPDGAVKDGADREVDRARRRVLDVRQDLIAFLERTIRALSTHEIPAGAGVTIRDRRYVIPVLRDARGRIPGIVHGESGSGATLFIEPPGAVERGNALAAAEAAEQRAVHALLVRLSDSAREHVSEIRTGFDMAVAVDDLFARARYAVDVKGVPPALAEARGAYRLRDARHPLLLAERADTVPFDLDLDATERGVVISGPNTGGKTVLLKAVGLMSAMTQAGIVPPLGAGSVVPVYRRIFADIGDHQSIEANLSTFSAHLLALRAALEGADEHALVLLDEIGTGTDPVDGAALAGAAVLTLVERGARTVATTHLGALKDLAAETDRVVNASLQFDGETLAPTYRLLKGVPGRSYGLVIARRLGLPADVLDRAEQRVPVEERSLDAMLADVEDRVAALDERELALQTSEARIRQERERLEQLAGDLAALDTTLTRRERDVERGGREQARAFLLQARKRVEEALGLARAAVDEATAREARRLVEEGIREEADELKRLEERLKGKGWRVSLGRTGGRADGAVETSVRPPVRPSARPTEFALEAATEVDVRGQRADEARIAVEQALDAAVVAGLPSLRIIHGKGTGALRSVVAETVAADRRVTAHRTAPPHEGGTGVTIVELA